ncbi:MAG: flagellar biosynthesis protein FliQ [Methylohalobius sp. ZOD2]|uniref:flagellar biosynthesis protein FliQ n=1 Tax=Methylohalobius crimeensis TaxID=244365 RepID=UPI0003B33149|nr:flagellar biosynthesis protein FliQ [Methylohalobius crimeensis]MBN2701234.1 flagellar biosynthesis protein FliQ [Methylothermaceae bacterium]
MDADTVMTVAHEMLWVTLKLAAPILIAVLAVGLLIAMFQAATQINEMTLTFVPKLIVVAIVLVVAGHWMLRLVVGYTRALFESIPSLIG